MEEKLIVQTDIPINYSRVNWTKMFPNPLTSQGRDKFNILF